MNRIDRLLLGLGIALVAAGIPGSAPAQTDKPFDFRPLLPPIVPVPPNSQVQSGAVGGRQDPYTTAPLQNPTQAPTQSSPGLRLTIPSR